MRPPSSHAIGHRGGNPFAGCVMVALAAILVTPECVPPALDAALPKRMRQPERYKLSTRLAGF